MINYFPRDPIFLHAGLIFTNYPYMYKAAKQSITLEIKPLIFYERVQTILLELYLDLYLNSTCTHVINGSSRAILYLWFTVLMTINNLLILLSILELVNFIRDFHYTVHIIVILCKMFLKLRICTYKAVFLEHIFPCRLKSLSWDDFFFQK